LLSHGYSPSVVRAGVAVRGLSPLCPGNMALYNRSDAELQLITNEMTFV